MTLYDHEHGPMQNNKLVANLWTECAAHHSEALATKCENRKTLDFLWWLKLSNCNFRKEPTLRLFVESTVRDLEVGGSSPLARPVLTAKSGSKVLSRT